MRFIQSFILDFLCGVFILFHDQLFRNLKAILMCSVYEHINIYLFSENRPKELCLTENPRHLCAHLNLNMLTHHPDT